VPRRRGGWDRRSTSLLLLMLMLRVTRGRDTDLQRAMSRRVMLLLLLLLLLLMLLLLLLLLLLVVMRILMMLLLMLMLLLLLLLLLLSLLLLLLHLTMLIRCLLLLMLLLLLKSLLLLDVGLLLLLVVVSRVRKPLLLLLLLRPWLSAMRLSAMRGRLSAICSRKIRIRDRLLLFHHCLLLLVLDLLHRRHSSHRVPTRPDTRRSRRTSRLGTAKNHLVWLLLRRRHRWSLLHTSPGSGSQRWHPWARRPSSRSSPHCGYGCSSSSGSDLCTTSTSWIDSRDCSSSSPSGPGNHCCRTSSCADGATSYRSPSRTARGTSHHSPADSRASPGSHSPRSAPRRSQHPLLHGRLRAHYRSSSPHRGSPSPPTRGRSSSLGRCHHRRSLPMRRKHSLRLDLGRTHPGSLLLYGTD
jgi:hypothetical protein